MLPRFLGAILLLLVLNCAYLMAFAHPTIFYMGNAVLHLVLGALFTVCAIWRYGVRWQNLILIAVAGIGILLVVWGNTFPNRWVLWLHILLGAAFFAAILP